MKLTAWMLLITMCMASAYGQEISKEINQVSTEGLFKKAGEYFAQGKYQSTVEELNQVELTNTDATKETKGLISYWKAICYSRNQDFPDSIASFEKAISYGYSPQDLNYEYGQALFAADKLKEARAQFSRSLKKKFKRAVSLYYIGYASKELGDRKKAYTYFKAIEKLNDKEAKEIRQAAEMQIGDIYLEQIERHPDAFRAVENYVIPQYTKALEINPQSGLAPVIQEKIVELQRKYELVLFQLRNGRPTLRPPYFMRFAAELGKDSNVTFTPNQTTVAKSKQSSLFARTTAMGKYTFYHEDFF